ncbi:MAG TPA: tetratricopeptide repeat protein [Thermoanaerobaculia bacterium]|nr:tetratricopeptide repeat protein [Thermoanaerobaculia bacterium]
MEEAEPLMRRAVAILERSLGPDHPRTQIGRENLEILLSEMVQEGASDLGKPSAPGWAALTPS